MDTGTVETYDFCLPSLGADMDEGTIVEWRVKPGDSVKKGDILLVVDTEKSAIDVEAWHDAVVVELLVATEETVSVGTALARMAAPDTTAPGAAPVSTGAPTSEPATVEAAPAELPAQPAVVHSPLIRHLADEVGVDLTLLRGTGPNGRVTRHDVERAAAPVAPAAPPVAPMPRSTNGTATASTLASPLARHLAQQRGVSVSDLTGSGPGGAIVARDVPTEATPARAEPTRSAPKDASSMRAVIARLMTRSKQEIPHYYLTDQIDLGVAQAWLEATNETRTARDRLVMAAVLIKATAVAARRHPELNGYWRNDAFEAADHVDVGLIVSLRGGGIVAPVIHDADRRGLDDVMADMRTVVTQARAGRLPSSAVSPPSITVTNLGDQGAASVHGVIYPPQVAIVGFGRVTDQPVVVDGAVVVRPVVVATLAGDHRATDGATGSRFLRTVANLLADPAALAAGQ